MKGKMKLDLKYKSCNQEPYTPNIFGFQKLFIESNKRARQILIDHYLQLKIASSTFKKCCLLMLKSQNKKLPAQSNHSVSTICFW